METPSPPTRPESLAPSTPVARELGRSAMATIAVVFLVALGLLIGAGWVFRERPGERVARIVNSGVLLGKTIPEAEKALRTPLHPSPNQPNEYDATLEHGILGMVFVHITTDGSVITQASTQVD